MVDRGSLLLPIQRDPFKPVLRNFEKINEKYPKREVQRGKHIIFCCISRANRLEFKKTCIPIFELKSNDSLKLDRDKFSAALLYDSSKKLSIKLSHFPNIFQPR